MSRGKVQVNHERLREILGKQAVLYLAIMGLGETGGPISEEQQLGLMNLTQEVADVIQQVMDCEIEPVLEPMKAA